MALQCTLEKFGWKKLVKIIFTKKIICLVERCKSHSGPLRKKSYSSCPRSGQYARICVHFLSYWTHTIVNSSYERICLTNYSSELLWVSAVISWGLPKQIKETCIKRTVHQTYVNKITEVFIYVASDIDQFDVTVSPKLFLYGGVREPLVGGAAAWFGLLLRVLSERSIFELTIANAYVFEVPGVFAHGNTYSFNGTTASVQINRKFQLSGCLNMRHWTLCLCVRACVCIYRQTHTWSVHISAITIKSTHGSQHLYHTFYSWLRYFSTNTRDKERKCMTWAVHALVLCTCFLCPSWFQPAQSAVLIHHNLNCWWKAVITIAVNGCNKWTGKCYHTTSLGALNTVTC